MKRLLSIVILFAVLVACKNDNKSSGEQAGTDKPAIDSTLVTDSTWGPITAATNFDELKKIYGDTHVKDERICGPECIDSLDVTKIYPNTAKEIIVYWKDSAYHQSIGLLQCYQDGFPYHTSNGIKAGSTMTDLLRINEKKISFSGFGWDYGGNIISYNGGKLDSLACRFRLDYKGQQDDNVLMGDIEVDTDMPDVKTRLDKIVVYQFTMGFYKE